MTGHILLPTVMLLARSDPADLVRLKDRYRVVFEEAGNRYLLRQHITDEAEDSKLAREEYPGRR